MVLDHSLSDSNVCQFPSLVIVDQRKADGSKGQGSLEQWHRVGVLCSDTLQHTLIGCEDDHSLEAVNERLPIAPEEYIA